MALTEYNPASKATTALSHLILLYFLPKALTFQYTRVPGMLLVDSVGLGKTIEMMGLIAMILQMRQAELQERVFASIVPVSPYCPVGV